MMKQDLKPNLGRAALEANREYFRSLRMKAHSEYLYWKRLERQTQEKILQLQPTSDSVRL
jgi:hypothetical protein